MYCLKSKLASNEIAPKCIPAKLVNCQKCNYGREIFIKWGNGNRITIIAMDISSKEMKMVWFCMKMFNAIGLARTKK